MSCMSMATADEYGKVDTHPGAEFDAGTPRTRAGGVKRKGQLQNRGEQQPRATPTSRPPRAMSASPPTRFKEPVVIHVKFVVFNILSINNETQDFMCDLMVVARASGQGYLLADKQGEDGKLMKKYDPSFQIMNIKDATVLFENHRQDGNDAVFKIRWRGVFTEEFELEQFPFDQQDFHLKLMAGSHTRTELYPICTVRPDACSLFQHHNFAMGNVWQIMKSNEAGSVKLSGNCDLKTVLTHLASSNSSNIGHGRSYPVLTASLRMRRRPWAFVWNVAIPMWIMTSMGYFSSGVAPQNLTSRLAITQTLMLTAVAYKFIATAGLPQLSYLTLLDMYVLCCFFFLTLVAIENFVVAVSDDASTTSDDAATAQLDKYLMYSWAVAWGTFNVVSFFYAMMVFKRNSIPNDKDDGGASSRHCAQPG